MSSFQLSAGVDPALAGLGVFHAFAALDSTTYGFTSVSNAVRTQLVP